MYLALIVSNFDLSTYRVEYVVQHSTSQGRKNWIGVDWGQERDCLNSMGVKPYLRENWV